MKEFEFTRYVVPLRDRMFRYAQSLLLCADEAEDVTHDLLERLWTERGRLDGCRDNALAGWAERVTTGMPKGGKRVTWCAVRWRSCPRGSARSCT